MKRTVTISMEDDLFRRLTNSSYELRTNRSQLACVAIEDFLSRRVTTPEIQADQMKDILIPFFRNRSILEPIEIERILQWLQVADPDFDIDHPLQSNFYVKLTNKFGQPTPETRKALLRVHADIYDPTSGYNPWEMDGLTKEESIELFNMCKAKEGGANRVGQT